MYCFQWHLPTGKILCVHVTRPLKVKAIFTEARFEMSRHTSSGHNAPGVLCFRDDLPTDLQTDWPEESMGNEEVWAPGTLLASMASAGMVTVPLPHIDPCLPHHPKKSMLENSDQLREKALVTSPGKQSLSLSYLEIMVLIPKPG